MVFNSLSNYPLKFLFACSVKYNPNPQECISSLPSCSIHVIAKRYLLCKPPIIRGSPVPDNVVFPIHSLINNNKRFVRPLSKPCLERNKIVLVFIKPYNSALLCQPIKCIRHFFVVLEQMLNVLPFKIPSFMKLKFSYSFHFFVGDALCVSYHFFLHFL